MKVNIGPYPNPLRTHGLKCDYLEFMYGEDWCDIEKEQYIWLDHIVASVLDGIQKWILDPFNKLFCKRKIKVKYHKYDTWNLDYTLSLIILPGLKQLKDTNHGHPNGLTEEEWASIMDEMIWAFNELANDNPGAEAFNSGEIDFVWVPCDIGKGYKELKHGPNHTFSVDMEGRKAYDERIQNGLNLFGKYYQNLWD